MIDFTAKLFGVGLKEAAQRLASDFGISYDDARVPPKPSINLKLKAVQEKQAEQQCFNTLCDYHKLLLQHKSMSTLRKASEELHPYFVEALRNMSYVEYLLDIMTFGENDERTAFVKNEERRLTPLSNELNSSPSQTEPTTPSKSVSDVKKILDETEKVLSRTR